MIKKLRTIAAVLIVMTATGCTNNKSTDNNQESIAQSADTATRATEYTMEASTLVDSVSILHVDLLQKFYFDQDYYYMGIGFKDGWNDSLYQVIERDSREISSDMESSRNEITHPDVASLFSAENIDTILVFDTNQELVSTVALTGRELIKTPIENQFVATYPAINLPETGIAISKDGYQIEKYQKSPQLSNDSVYWRNYISSQVSENDYVTIYGCTTIEADTLCIYSFSNYMENRAGHVLLKNGNKVDSLFKNIVFLEFHPVRLASDNEIHYVARTGIPDTDAIWTEFFSIQLDSLKIKVNAHNQFKVE